MSLQGNVVLMNLGFTSYEEAHEFVQKHRKPKAQMPEHSRKAAALASIHNLPDNEESKVFSDGVQKRELTFLRDICHGNAVNAGWYTDIETGEYKELNVGERHMLIVSEVAESFEGHRKDQMDDKLPHRKMIEVEMADTIIRIMDFCGDQNLDIAGAIVEKQAYNLRRKDHKLENRRLEGGKKC